MVLKHDQQRVKSQLTDAIISVLNRNGLSYRSEYCIEGLLGITLDSHDIFLVNIKETIRSANLTGCSPPSKDPSLAPLDLMVLNSLGPSLGDPPTGEDLTMKNTTMTSTPGKKGNSFCHYLDTGADMCVKGDTSFNFALNYADYDVIEDLSRAGCGKRIQNLTMDDLSMLDNDMGIIMEKDVLPPVQPPLEQKCADKVSTMKAAGMDSGFEAEEQEETLDLSLQEDDVPSTPASSKPPTPETEEGMPLNLSEPKKKKMNKKKFECSSCHKFYVSEASLSKHKCKAASETSQPLDLTVGRLEEGQLIIVVPDSQSSAATPEALNKDTAATDTEENSTLTAAAAAEEPSTADNNNNSDDDDESFVCVCGRVLAEYSSYITHTTHCAKAKLTPYKACEICCKVFFSNSGYVKHKRLHVGAYKLRCRYCQKGFFDSTHLNAHVDARHNKVRRFECPHCDKGFYWKHHLKRHLTSCLGAAGEQSITDNSQQQQQQQEQMSLSSPVAPDTTDVDMDTEEGGRSQFDDSTTMLECQWTCNIKAS